MRHLSTRLTKERDCMKKLIALVLALVCVLGLVGCGRTMNDIIENEPNVTGIVEEVHDNYIVMYAETADGYPNGTRWSISLNVENKDSYTDIVVGGEIGVCYDGMAAVTDPLEVSTVYAITLKTPADRLPDIERTEEPDEYPPTNIVSGFDLDEPSEPTE